MKTNFHFSVSYDVQYLRAPTPKLLLSNSGPVRGIISKAAIGHDSRLDYQPLFEKGARSPSKNQERM